MPTLCLAEHCADQSVEQIDGVVSQARDQVEGDGNQCGMTPLSFVSSDMLRRGTICLAAELCEASLMNAVATRRIESDRPNVVQALDQTEHRNRLCRFWHLAQPGKPALAGLR